MSLPREACGMPWEVAGHGNWLRGEQSPLNVLQESAEGIVGEGTHGRPERYRAASRSAILWVMRKAANSAKEPLTGKLE